MKRNLLLFLSVVLSDLLSKLAVSHLVPLYGSHPVIGEFLTIQHVENRGMVFGILQASPQGVVLFKLLSVPVLVIFAAYLLFFRRGRNDPVLDAPAVKAAIAVLTGGAVANFIDRLGNGGVLDFISVGIGSIRWYTFNLADAYMVLAAVWLMALVIRAETQKVLSEKRGAQ